MTGDAAVRRTLSAVLLMVVAAVMLGLWPAHSAAAPAGPTGRAVVYFFWGEGCPHCAAAKPVVADIGARNPGMVVRDYEVFENADNRTLFAAMAARLGFEPSGVPTIILGERHWVGFAENQTGPELEEAVKACLATGCPDAGEGLVAPLPPAPPPSAPPPSASQTPGPQPSASSAPTTDQGFLDLPVIGRVDLAGQSLVVTTALIALVDGVNPCSLWVLTVLLALALRTGSRRLTVLIGLVFITVTALVYALFIAGIFSVLTVLTIAGWVRILVALVAAGFAVVSIKDYFWFRQGLSLSIPEDKKPGIYRKMRAIARDADNVPAMIAGTAALAAGVSLVELACTAGFPVVWSNILTANGVPVATFVGLLVLYMLIYQADELVIFGAAVLTLRASKLEERHGRILKLVGGMLMLTLAAVMIIDPDVMNTLAGSLIVFGAALVATVLVLVLHRVVLPRFGVRIGTPEPDAARSRR